MNVSATVSRAPDERARVVERAPEAPRANILAIATEEFAEKGFSGARVDDIAARTDTSKRMIYYYFGDKEGLFVAVIERAYAGIREIEANLKLDHLDPEQALRTLVGFTFDYQNAHEGFIRLVMVENIHRGAPPARPPRPLAGAAHPRRLHRRLADRPGGFHPPRDGREHPPRRAPRPLGQHRGTQRAGDRDPARQIGRASCRERV